MKEYDCIVVGGGPVGGYVAQKIAEKKHSVVLIEEHRDVGLPVNCAGLVTSRVLNFAQEYQDKFTILSIKGAHVHSPLNQIYTIGGDKTHAYVINREIFDKGIVEKARKFGAEILLGSQVVSIEKDPGIVCSYRVNKQKAMIRGKLLIGADGPHSIVRRSFDFPSPIEYIRCVGAEVSNISMDPRYVEIFFNSRIAPGFFAWIIPINAEGTRARIGLGVVQKFSNSLKKCFKNFISYAKLDNAIVESMSGGSIPLGGLNRTTQEGVMLVGDAAAQVKPTSGGGLFPGLSCAQICADVGLKALKINRVDDNFLSMYHSSWTKAIGKELTKGMFYRRIFFRFSNREFEKALKFLDNKRILNCINSYGDIDYPSRLVVPVMKAMPMLLKSIPGLFMK